MPHSPLERLKIDEWDRMIDVNIKGVLYGIAAALPQMKQQKAGHIINVSSVAGHKVVPGGVVYCATKHAVRALSEGLRQEVKPYNIWTTIISPGAVATELPNSITEPDVAEGIHKFYEAFAIPADSFAQAVGFAMSQPDEVDVNEILFRPTRQELLHSLAQCIPGAASSHRNSHVDAFFPTRLPENHGDRSRGARRSGDSPRPDRRFSHSKTGVHHGNQTKWITAIHPRIGRVFHRHGAH
jgi:hypothetical protein